ncbi:SemiSWEET family sugar transporter [Dongia deserti]|uniref:SemiSWEET family sugar transporter n=1 Tax=Dongia deserti TaxID=2268030 RepID=UPI000E65B209|nr:SemiSWEET transporter [Dongia deserti]
MDVLTNLLGGLAAFLTTIANVPQVIKCFRTGRSGDLSKKMLIALSLGFALWLTYGLLRDDLIIAAANAISLGLVAILLGFKWRERNELAEPDP